jgi:aminoglycoside 3-N-acetyltransferase
MQEEREMSQRSLSHSVVDYDYDFNDLLDAYSALGVAKGGLIFVASDLSRLMRYADSSREALVDAHLRALRELLGASGTLFVPTASLNLCNTDTVFDPKKTPSSEMGVFSEHVRTRPGAVRSFHPFWSITGIGPAASDVLGNLPRHAYGWDSVLQRFVARDVLGITIGKSPHYAIPVIHHIETVMGVPYRYNKEFIHPVMRNGAISREPFYLSVLYRDCDIVRDRNRKVMDHFAWNGTLREAPIGRGKAWAFSHREFFDATTHLFARDIYSWLERPPETRPYQI